MIDLEYKIAHACAPTARCAQLGDLSEARGRGFSAAVRRLNEASGRAEPS